jgi:hypothetical protein
MRGSVRYQPKAFVGQPNLHNRLVLAQGIEP